jgi:hypothetical protein
MTLCHDAESRYTKCHTLFIVMLNVILLSVAMLNVVGLKVVLISWTVSVFMLNIVAKDLLNKTFTAVMNA